jgi:CheY-like chemotaxis protein
MPFEASASATAGTGLSIEAKLRAAFELSPTVLAITTAGEGRLLEVNQAFTGALHANPLPMSITRLDDGVHLEVNEAAVRHSGFMVVEDNADARDMLRTLLELKGHVVEDVAEGPSALGRLPSFRPDIALIDLGLPGMDGYTLARMVREHPRWRGDPARRRDGYGQSRDRERALAAGFDRHVTKPVAPLALERLVSEL